MTNEDAVRYQLKIINSNAVKRKEKCIAEFKAQYNKEKALIAWIKTNKIRILNSGIKVT